MASDILHIKDSYYFDVPKTFWRSNIKEAKDFPKWLVRLDDDFQQWQAAKLIARLNELDAPTDVTKVLEQKWIDWQHAGHSNHGWPLHAYVEAQAGELASRAKSWAAKLPQAPRDPVAAYLAEKTDEPFAWFVQAMQKPEFKKGWESWKQEQLSDATMQSYLASPGASWSSEKIYEYNRALDGKVLIPQVFGGELRNAYEPLSGFCLSKFMIIEVVVAILALLIFRWLGKRVGTGQAPKGKAWNFLEGLLLFIRNQVVVPAMGEEDADAFLPFMWSIFVFIFGCNLMGMLPWLGSPTASMSMTGILALMIFVIGVYFGVREFGVLGFLKNICPSLGLPLAMSILIVPLLWVIEFVSMLIKHFILGLRLVANMVAGHAVLLGVMGLAIGAHAMTMNTAQWSLVTMFSLVLTTVLSFLELFVAFLQAAIFTFLSALFISSAKHHH